MKKFHVPNFVLILIDHCSSLSVKARQVTGKFYKNSLVSKMKKKHEKSKHATDLRGLCLIHENACAHKCELVPDFLEMETVVQIHNPSYSPDLSACDFFLFTLLKKQSLQTSILSQKCSWQCHCSVSTGCAQKIILICIQSLDFNTRN